MVLNYKTELLKITWWEQKLLPFCPATHKMCGNKTLSFIKITVGCFTALLCLLMICLSPRQCTIPLSILKVYKGPMPLRMCLYYFRSLNEKQLSSSDHIKFLFEDDESFSMIITNVSLHYFKNILFQSHWAFKLLELCNKDIWKHSQADTWNDLPLVLFTHVWTEDKGLANLMWFSVWICYWMVF